MRPPWSWVEDDAAGKAGKGAPAIPSRAASDPDEQPAGEELSREELSSEQPANDEHPSARLDGMVLDTETEEDRIASASLAGKAHKQEWIQTCLKRSMADPTWISSKDYSNIADDGDDDAADDGNHEQGDDNSDDDGDRWNLHLWKQFFSYQIPWH